MQQGELTRPKYPVEGNCGRSSPWGLLGLLSAAAVAAVAAASGLKLFLRTMVNETASVLFFFV